MSEDRQLCTFFVDQLYLGIPVSQVQEVIRFQEMTRVPLAPGEISGLINLRGEIVTAIDLRLRMGLPARGSDKLPMNVVIHTEDGAVSFLVDEIGDVLEVETADYERPPENLEGPARDLIRGLYKLEDKLLLILDVENAADVVAVGASPVKLGAK